MSDKPKVPDFKELVRGASLAFKNAQDLFREAEALSASGAFSRALFLHQISLEECGKAEMIGWWATGCLMGRSVDLAEIGSRLRQHKAKNFANAYMLPMDESERQACSESDWQRAMEAFKGQQAEFHKQSNDRKNASLYVDIVDNTFVDPDSQITEDMVREIAQVNGEFIDLMLPKIEMLRLWAQNPDDTRERMKGFQDLMERCREEHAGDPQAAFEALLKEMLARQKET